MKKVKKNEENRKMSWIRVFFRGMVPTVDGFACGIVLQALNDSAKEQHYEESGNNLCLRGGVCGKIRYLEPIVGNEIKSLKL